MGVYSYFRDESWNWIEKVAVVWILTRSKGLLDPKNRFGDLYSNVTQFGHNGFLHFSPYCAILDSEIAPCCAIVDLLI